MLNIINPRGEEALTAGEKYTLRQKLRPLLSEEKGTYVYVQPLLNGLVPDFVVISKKFGVLIIEVKDWSDDHLQEANKKNVICDNKAYRNPIFQVLGYSNHIKTNLTRVNDFINDDGECAVSVRSVIFFVNLSEEKLEEYKSAFQHKDVTVFHKSALRKLTYEQLVEKTKMRFSDKGIDALRGSLFPEIVIPQDSGEPFDAEKLVRVSKIKILDEEQEEFAKKLPNGHYMVSGLPGSGKTVMLLTRALYIAKNTKTSRVLILTYTNALALKLKDQLQSKATEMHMSEDFCKRIEVLTFHKLCYELVGRPSQPPERSDEDYYNEYWPKEAIRAINVNNIKKYNAVLVDEYQDFHRDWFDLCKAICVKPKGRDENIFLAGDRLQRIYKVPWDSYKEIGLNIVGRSKLLKKAYRTHADHMAFALKFLSKDDKLAKDVTRFYELDKLDGIELIGCVDVISGEKQKVYDQLSKLVDSGVQPSDILVLCHHKYEINDLIKGLPTRLKSNFAEGKVPTKGKSLVTTYHSSKGLEAKYCVLMSVENFKDKSIDRILMYVGMTRASEQLLIHYRYNTGFAKDIEDILGLSSEEESFKGEEEEELVDFGCLPTEGELLECIA